MPLLDDSCLVLCGPWGLPVFVSAAFHVIFSDPSFITDFLQLSCFQLVKKAF